MNTVLKIFAKAPVPGTVKTRLIPALGDAGAARLQRWLTVRTVDVACRAGYAAVELWCAPDTRDPFFVSLAGEYPLVLRTQAGDGLGARMLNALDGGPGAGAQVIVGTDCPELGTGVLVAAREALVRGGVDVVLGPAEDGGYVLIGMCLPVAPLFSTMPWGTSRVAALTRRRLRALGMRTLELDPLRDLDRPEDLRWLAGLPGDPPLSVEHAVPP